MIKKITKVTLCIILVMMVFSLLMAWRLDVFVTINEKKPNSCQAIKLEGSAEDIEIDYKNGIAYLSILDRRGLIEEKDVQGSIGKINLNSKPWKLESIFSGEGLDNFRPHGLSLYGNTLAAINHPKQRGIEAESIEMFSISETGIEHKKTLISSLLESPNDLVLVAEDRLYIGNDSMFNSNIGSFEKIQEQLGRPYSTIVFYDGIDMTIASRNLASVSGLNLTKEGYIIASETNAKRIRVLKQLNDGKLEKLGSISLDGSPDNISVLGNQIIVAQVASVVSLIQHFISLQNGDYKPSPSKIESLIFDPNKAQYFKTKEILFLSLGDDISTASVGVQWEDNLLIGSITDDKVYVCKLEE